jgi:hypothetical protein
VVSGQRIDYGPTCEFFVTRKPHGKNIVLTGEGTSDRWTRVLTQRCAHMLWFHLTEMLFPEKANMVGSVAETAPLQSPDTFTVTTEVVIERTPEGHILLAGSSGIRVWTAAADEEHARRLWTSLDIALYPVGWEGAHVERKLL